MMDSAFVFHETGDIPFYSCRALDRIPGVRHGFSTRLGSRHSTTEQPFNLGETAWDTPGNVDGNRRRFLTALNLETILTCELRQIHSCRVHIIKEVPAKWNPPQADALIAGIPGVALAVRTADCLPVLIADPAGGAIAAVHSGWRGTLQQVAFHTVREMQRSLGSNPADLQVAVGPAIRSCCYEVGEDVYARFEKIRPNETAGARAPGTAGKFLLDLPGILNMQLQRAGILPDNIYDLGLCTGCRTDLFFSYRAEGERSGRMMAAIGRA